MSVLTPPIARPLRASVLNWKRLRRLAFNSALLAGAVAGTVFFMNGGVASVLLRADGYIARDHVAVAPEFEGRVTQIFVRPGDRVEEGQKIAVVKSLAISRTLSDVAAEKARLTARIGELEAQRQIIAETLPLARSSAIQTAAYLDQLTSAQRAGLSLNKSIQEMTSASVTRAEQVASMTAEQESLPAELQAHRSALAEANSTYEALSAAYADGVLYASVSGDIGANVAQVGQVLSPGAGEVAEILTGRTFVLAYLPDTYLFDVSEGQAIGVKVGNRILNAQIDRILPVAASLPTDLQTPNRSPERGRIMRVSLTEPNQFPVDQRVQITTCWASDCRVGLVQAMGEQARNLLSRFSATTTAQGAARDESAQNDR